MSDIDWDLLFRYLGSECSAEERERFEAWLRADPRNRAILDAAAAAAARVLDRRHAPSPPLRILVRRTAAARKRSWRAAAVAASLVLAAGAALAWWTMDLRQSGVRDSMSELRVATASRGERATLELPDGTRVVLGPATTLRYPEAFSERSRDVHLTGEAYFVVEPDARRPFRVHATGGVAEDLGTAFSARAYPEDSALRVVVAEGAVALGAGAAGSLGRTVLRRGQLGRLAVGDSVVITARVDAEAYVGWIDGRLTFDETPLPEALAQLGRWYDVTFQVRDTALARSRLTASFATQSLDQVIRLLAPVLDARFERRGDTVLVRPGSP